jgi:hypothetical protein
MAQGLRGEIAAPYRVCHFYHGAVNCDVMPVNYREGHRPLMVLQLFLRVVPATELR